eukprot:2819952-Pleurochrysis_carterae.AAC.1
MNHGRNRDVGGVGGRTGFNCELTQQLTPTARNGRGVRASRRLAYDGLKNSVHHLTIDRIYYFRSEYEAL